MIMLVFEDQLVFWACVIIIAASIGIYALQKKRGKIRQVVTLGEDEVLFDEKFPPLPGSEAEKKLQEKNSK